MSTPKLSAYYVSDEETQGYAEILRAMRDCPIPDDERLKHLPLFMNRSLLGHILFMDELYRRILRVHGLVMEFGVRWGRNLALFTMLRSLYEPHNFSRRVVGFDTFGGFPSVSPKDGSSQSIEVGTLAVTPGYEEFLAGLLGSHEKLAPRSHLRKFELVKGDATETLPRYLRDHPETIVALAYIDFDLYEPTKKCLELIRDRLTKGSVLAFDELALPEFPGETAAFQEIIGCRHARLRRSPLVPYQSYLVVE